jgi:DNA polymerase III gamma/tau subunit
MRKDSAVNNNISLVKNFPYEHRPKSWGEVVYQDVVKTIMQSWLRNNCFPNFAFCQGATGLGKTSITKLLIQTTHCLNRQPCEVNNCGTCAVCQSDPQLTTGYSNVIWVTAGNYKNGNGEDITYQQAIKDALARADMGPVRTGHSHRDILFVIFEEAHLMPKDLFQRSLSKADTQNPFAQEVCFIFLTMSPDEINDTARQAVAQRGAILNFSAPTTEQLKDFIRGKFTDLDDETALLIAIAATNSIRGALSAYKDCLDFQTPITKQSAAQRLRFLNPKDRYELWLMIKDKTKARPFYERAEQLLQNSSPTHLATLLLKDLDDSYELLKEDVWLPAALIINEFRRRPDVINLAYSLHNLRALDWPKEFPPKPADLIPSGNYESLLNAPWPSLLS